MKKHKKALWPTYISNALQPRSVQIVSLSAATRVTFKDQQLSCGALWFSSINMLSYSSSCQSVWVISSLWTVCNNAVAKSGSRGRCGDSQALAVRVSRQAQETMMKCGISVVINSFSRSSSSRSVPFPPTAGREGSLWSVCVRFLWHTVHLCVCVSWQASRSSSPTCCWDPS